jgi:hypothetical protein
MFNSSRSHHVDRWLKVIGALFVLYISAKIIGAVLSPGMVFLGIALWLVVRSHNKRQSKPVMQYVPAHSPHHSTPAYSAPVYVPQPPRGYWMPTAAPQYAPTQRAAAPLAAAIIDTRTDAEREIETYVEHAWPHVKLHGPTD